MANAHKYSVSAMCKVQQIPRSTYYYEAKQTLDSSSLNVEIREIFRKSRNNYGTRKIKVEPKKKEPYCFSQTNWKNHEGRWTGIQLYGGTI